MRCLKKDGSFIFGIFIISMRPPLSDAEVTSSSVKSFGCWNGPLSEATTTIAKYLWIVRHPKATASITMSASMPIIRRTISARAQNKCAWTTGGAENRYGHLR